MINLVKIIMGLKGSGKTKKLVELVRGAVANGDGDVVCIEKERKLTYDASAYDIGTYEFFKGFICGMHAGNYDITHFYIDNFFKLVEDKSEESFAAFIAWLDKFSAQENIEFVLSCSADPEKAPESVKPLLI